MSSPAAASSTITLQLGCNWRADALIIAVDAIKRAGTTDKAKVREAIEQTKNLMGTGGLFNMSATDHMGLDLTAFRMLEVRNGDWTLVKN